MADKNFRKLQRFVEAALTNPTHPVYRLGMAHSPILQHYAINVATLGAVTPEAWFAEDPARTAKLEEVMALCEAGEAEALAEAEKRAVTTDKVAAQSTALKALEATVAEQAKKIDRLLATLESQGTAGAEETEGDADSADEGDEDDENDAAASDGGGGDEDEPFDGLEDDKAED